MTESRVSPAALLVSILLFSSSRAAAQAPGIACCVVVAVDAGAGVVTAKVNANGKIFQFKAIGVSRAVAYATPLVSLKPGHAVYANFANQQVSLDGRTVCCSVITEGHGGQLVPKVMSGEPANFWTTMAPMSAIRSGAVGGLVNGVLYVAGGSGGGNNHSQVEAYDPSTNTWTAREPKPAMASPRAAVAGGVADGILYVVGGVAWPATKVATVEAYDPATNTWTTKAPMPTAKSNATAAVVNGVLYVVGGLLQNGVAVDDVDAYYPATNTWRKMPRIVDGTGNTVSPPRSYGAAAAVMNGILYVVGGVVKDVYGDFYVLPEVEAYDPATNLWRSKAAMTTARAGATVDAAMHFAQHRLEVAAFGEIISVRAMAAALRKEVLVIEFTVLF